MSYPIRTHHKTFTENAQGHRLLKFGDRNILMWLDQNNLINQEPINSGMPIYTKNAAHLSIAAEEIFTAANRMNRYRAPGNTKHAEELLQHSRDLQDLASFIYEILKEEQEIPE